MTTQFWGGKTTQLFRSKTTQNDRKRCFGAPGGHPIPEHCHPFRSITTQTRGKRSGSVPEAPDSGALPPNLKKSLLKASVFRSMTTQKV